MNPSIEPFVVGSLHCQAAIFCYKADSTVDALKDDLNTMVGNVGQIRGEIHREKTRFLEALKEWNKQSDPQGAFLCIYAHAGGPGIAPIGGEEFRSNPNRDSLLVTWDELAHAIPFGVACLWLLGCRTEQALKNWESLRSPVLRRLLATNEKFSWRPFVKWFAAEIGFNPIVYYDEMVPLLLQKTPELAGHTQYFGADLKPVAPASVRDISETDQPA
jgi:hypothetical protein